MDKLCTHSHDVNVRAYLSFSVLLNTDGNRTDYWFCGNSVGSIVGPGVAGKLHISIYT